MQYNPHLSNQLDCDIFIQHNGVIYLQFKSNMYNIGTTASSVSELRDAVSKYI